MKKIQLKANIRKTTGNGPARSLRREGHLPAVFYGPGAEPVLLSIDTADFDQIIKSGNPYQVLIDLTIDNGKSTTKPAMIKELQTHPISREFLHVDFYEIDMKRKINVNVPVVTTGKAAGVELGGILQIIRRELEVSCLPGAIPESIEIDITELNIGDSVHVQEVPLEGDVEIPADVNFTVLTVVSPKVEEEPVEEEELEEGVEGEGEEETPEGEGEEEQS